MNPENFNASQSRRAEMNFSFKDLAIALSALVAFVVLNCGVVRALDVALDALHR